MADLAAWLGVLIAALSLIVQISQPSRTRRRSRRFVTRWKGFGIEWSRRYDDTDDQA